MFRWAVSEEILPREVGPALCAQLNAVENLHKGKDSRVHEGRKVPPALKPDVRKARRFMSPQIRAMVDLQLITGMRPDEVTIILRSAGSPADFSVISGISTIPSWTTRRVAWKRTERQPRRLACLSRRPRTQSLTWSRRQQ